VESTVNQVISNRMVNKQQMHWSLAGTQLPAGPYPGPQQRRDRGLPALVPPGLHPPGARSSPAASERDAARISASPA